MSFMWDGLSALKNFEVYSWLLADGCLIPPPRSDFCLSQITPSGMGVDCILFQSAVSLGYVSDQYDTEDC